MNVIFSKRLCAIIPPQTEIKINGTNYKVNMDFPSPIETSEDNYTIEIDNFSGEFNYFCYNKNNKITAWPIKNGEQPLNDSGKWKKEGRQELKPGKFLLLLTDFIRCYDEYSDKVIEEVRVKLITRLCEIFTDKIRGINEEISFSLSDNISSIYETDAHSSSGYLRDSCMRSGSSYGCGSYSHFYNFINGLQILHKTVNGELLFRALLWQGCENDEETNIIFLDRIYGTEAHNIQLKEYAESQGWAFRQFNDNGIKYKGNYINLKKQIPDEAYNYLKNEGSPYVDTLNRLTHRDGKYYLSNYLNSDYHLTDCEGTAVSGAYFCADGGERVDENEIYHSPNGDILCVHCYNERYCYCDSCGNDVDRDNMVNCNDNWYCEDCAEREGYYKCYDCGEYHNDGINIDGDYYCMNCFNDNFRHCEICEEDRKNDEVNNICVDGENKNVCDDCRGELNKCDECENYFTDELENNLCPDCIEVLKESEVNN